MLEMRWVTKMVSHMDRTEGQTFEHPKKMLQFRYKEPVVNIPNGLVIGSNTWGEWQDVEDKGYVTN